MHKKNASSASKVSIALVRGVIRLYQLVLSPWLAPRCRFMPTCSSYMHHALEQHGLFRGIYLGLRRLLRCHPFNPGGYDPVPNQEAPKK